MNIVRSLATASGSIALCLAVAGASAEPRASGIGTDALAAGFDAPPPAARPRVWWDWMDGNISADNAVRDLDWFARIGIGGVYLFESGLPTPLILPQKVSYMASAWQSALRRSVDAADRRHLDFGIATSPGWSETGGPQVRPTDAMKKLVWSKTDVPASARGPIRTTPPPCTTGPFQDIDATAIEGEAAAALPTACGTIRVIAIPAATLPVPRPVAITSSQGPLDSTLLTDGKWGRSIALKPDPASHQAWITVDFGRPVTLRSIRLGLPMPTGFGAPKPVDARLAASKDGVHFLPITELPAGASPMRSTDFPAATARWFRLDLYPRPGKTFIDQQSYAPGAIRPSFGPATAPAYTVSELDLSPRVIVRDAAAKAGFATVPDYYAVPTPPADGIAPAAVRDLTNRLRPDGTLAWSPPAGAWTILRFGWSLTGHRNGPAPAKATGLEVDKLDRARVTAYIDAYLDRYAAILGPGRFGASGLNSLISDSIEAGPQNWTDDLLAQFKQRRGYDPLPWLPALTGTIVGNAAATDRFLWDWRKTIADLYASAHYGAIAAAAHRRGLSYAAEALEDHRPQLGDDMAMRAAADVPMGAMWVIDRDDQPKPTYVADLKGAASVADLYGKRIVGAESFTAFGHPYAYAPADLKATADLEFALGVNRIMIHSSAHQPLADSPPGLALAPFLGQYFTRNETWAPMAGAWIAYLARTSYLLQQGRHVADIAYFFGEEAPLTSLYGDGGPTDIPSGHDYDFVDAAALRDRLSVADGRLVTPNGMRFRLLQLGGSSHYMTLGTLDRLLTLVRAGATLVGDRPIGSPSLADNPREVGRAIAALWGQSGAGPRPRTVGRGRVYPAGAMAAALADIRLQPDWTWASDRGDGAPNVIHRARAGLDLYFVSNPSGRPTSGTIDLRISGRAPELWHADTGTRTPASYSTHQGRTRVPIALPAHGSVFVLFRQQASAPGRTILPPVYRTVRVLDHHWTLRFQPDRGAPSGTIATGLTPWNDNSDPAIRYFSGIGTYRTTIEMSGSELNGTHRLLLDLGRVGDVARVIVNGKDSGVVWKAPYRIDITDRLHAGENALTVEVANLWVNRLIGDARPGADKIAHSYGATYRPDAPLRFSGLAGPVRVIAATNHPED